MSVSRYLEHRRLCYHCQQKRIYLQLQPPELLCCACGKMVTSFWLRRTGNLTIFYKFVLNCYTSVLLKMCLKLNGNTLWSIECSCTTNLIYYKCTTNSKSSNRVCWRGFHQTSEFEIKLKFYCFILSVPEPCNISGYKECCEPKLYHLHWISSVRLLHSDQLDYLYMSTVSFLFDVTYFPPDQVCVIIGFIFVFFLQKSTFNHFLFVNVSDHRRATLTHSTLFNRHSLCKRDSKQLYTFF